VFLEAAACGVPQIAGNSGGAAEAVAHGETGFVMADPQDATALARTLDSLFDDQSLMNKMQKASRTRAETEFNYDLLADRLAKSLGVVS
jgi:phosphatidylinositol alpha-1,6-mannosyltransferase